MNVLACSRHSVGKRDRNIQAEQGRNKAREHGGGMGRASKGTPDTTVCGLAFGVVNQTGNLISVRNKSSRQYSLQLWSCRSPVFENNYFARCKTWRGFKS